MAGTTFAARGSANSSIWVMELTTARASGGLQFGDSFTVEYQTTRTDQPWARVFCYANETTVVSDAARKSNNWPLIWGQYHSV